MKLQLWSLLPLVWVACLQTVDQASQDASGDTGTYKLIIVQQKVIEDKNKTYHAGITEVLLAAREAFGNPVELQKDKPLHDKSPLVFKNIAFDFSANKTMYDCTLKNANLQLLRQIPFSAGKCEQTTIRPPPQLPTHQYGKYVLKHDKDEKRVVVKIEINAEGVPSKLYTRNLKKLDVLEADLKPKRKPSPSFGGPTSEWVGYSGKIAEGVELVVKYPEDPQEIDKMINSQKLQLPELDLIYTSDNNKTYTSDKKKSVSIDASEYKLLTSNNLSDFLDLAQWFDNNCREKVSLTNPQTPSNTSGVGRDNIVEIGDRVYTIDNTLALNKSRCPAEANRPSNYNLHGITAPRVVKYLKDCPATCTSIDGKKPLVIVLEGINIDEDCSGKATAFYVQDERLYLVNVGLGNLENEVTSTFWINCATNERGTID